MPDVRAGALAAWAAAFFAGRVSLDQAADAVTGSDAPHRVNGLPGFVTLEADGELQTTALEIEDGKITAIYVVRNPDKLRHLH